MLLLARRIQQAARVARHPSAWLRGVTAWARRTVGCGELRAEHAAQEVTLTGWITTPRHLGGMAFAPIRDATGVAQLVWDHDKLSRTVAELSPETVVSVRGTVRPRPADQVRADQPTGAIEVLVTACDILNQADPLPFPLQGKPANEDTRLKYRHIDLRRPENQQMLQIRSRALHAARSWLHERRFLEIETPLLFRATPEGAREFLVPTRSPERFFALPQSPQQFKQMLIASGVERYACWMMLGWLEGEGDSVCMGVGVCACATLNRDLCGLIFRGFHLRPSNNLGTSKWRAASVMSWAARTANPSSPSWIWRWPSLVPTAHKLLPPQTFCQPGVFRNEHSP